MERALQRKARLLFETAIHPVHVTFDDGKAYRRNFPWHDFVEARWDHDEPDTILLEIGHGVVVLRGHNLGPLFAAIEDQSLFRVRAQPEKEAQRDHEEDTFLVEIRFAKGEPPLRPPSNLGQSELDLRQR